MNNDRKQAEEADKKRTTKKKQGRQSLDIEPYLPFDIPPEDGQQPKITGYQD